ncbi:peptidyl-prolyl cis-trans isomerase [Arhodomonas sp. AD133]|uniref:peptidyl-prolyl cis-trans isomerase n=1 Tax=Arhodomonas sp. AD133 TaxID=3415009 RepID=UPI003EBAC293
MRVVAAIGLVMTAVLAGCGGGENDASGVADTRAAASAPVLAHVDGTDITAVDLELAVGRLLDGRSTNELDRSTREKVLRSLVRARVIANHQAARLGEADRAELERKVAAYREDLLMKRFLRDEVTAEPVTEEMMREYYDRHPERFGARTVRTYELLTTREEVLPASRDEVLDRLKTLGRTGDWAAAADSISVGGPALRYRQVALDDATVAPRLRKLLRSIEGDERSSITFIRGRPYIARVAAVENIPPQPLSEVRGQLRRALAPVRVKAALQEASAPLIEAADIEYAGEFSSLGDE